MRYILLKKVVLENGIEIYNPTSVKWTKFEFKQGFKTHILSQVDILKPYMISYAYFGTVDYDDLLLLINGIDDIFELTPGVEIKIPYIQDIQDFILANKI